MATKNYKVWATCFNCDHSQHTLFPMYAVFQQYSPFEDDCTSHYVRKLPPSKQYKVDSPIGSVKITEVKTLKRCSNCGVAQLIIGSALKEVRSRYITSMLQRGINDAR